MFFYKNICSEAFEDKNINEDIIGVKIAQPRSYISSEPAVLRANRNNFDVYKQIHDRANTLINMGHPLDKLEIISVAEVFGESIKRIVEGTSLSSMFHDFN